MIKTVITNAGEMLRQKIIAEKGTIEFTKARLGSGRISNPNTAKSRTDVLDYKADAQVKSSLSINAVHELVATIKNSNVETAFTVYEIGIFAKDNTGKEIMYSYTYTDIGEYVPDKNIVNVTREWVISTAISQTENVTIVVNDSNVYVTMGDVQEAIDEARAVSGHLEGLEESIVGVQTGLAGKAPIVHTHNGSDIDNGSITQDKLSPEIYFNTSPTLYIKDTPIYGTRFVEVTENGEIYLNENGTGDYLVTLTENGKVLAVKVINDDEVNKNTDNISSLQDEMQDAQENISELAQNKADLAYVDTAIAELRKLITEQSAMPVMLFEKTESGFIRNEDGSGDHILVGTPNGGYSLMPFPTYKN